MSRIRHFTRALASGYAALGANVLYTLAAVPLALQYLEKEEFGLWALVMQIAGYLALLDFGISGAVYRLLIDHKDQQDGGEYKDILTTGAYICALQGFLIAGAGWLAGPLLGKALQLPLSIHAPFVVLIGGQCTCLAFSVATRILSLPLMSHQRNDIYNLVQMAQFGILFGTLWIGFAVGCGIWSMLVAHAVSALLSSGACAVASLRLGLLPKYGAWGTVRGAIARQLFRFGGNLFLLTVGWQLISGSQLLIVTRVLGLEAAAIWSIGTKVFILAQQFVWRLFDFAQPAFAEMYVRGEDIRLRHRFGSIVLLTATTSILSAGLIAAFNTNIVHIWTQGQIKWNHLNDWLLGSLLVLTSVSRCLTLFVGVTKEIRGTQYIYFLEGITILAGGWAATRFWGIPGLICVAIIANVLWSGSYGLHRVCRHFGFPVSKVFQHWLARPAAFACAFALTVATIANSRAWIPLGTLPAWHMAGEFCILLVLGAILAWCLGLPVEIREELRARFR